MKFKTQHIKVASGHSNYGLHRDGKVTWQTTSSKSGEDIITDEITHASVAQAKALLGSITSSTS